jgi:hypothetical protein
MTNQYRIIIMEEEERHMHAYKFVEVRANITLFFLVGFWFLKLKLEKHI